MAWYANLINLILEIIGLQISISRRKWRVFAYYTQLSNMVTFVSSLLYVLIGDIVWLRYLSTCMLVMTFIIAICVLIPMGGDAKELLIRGNGLYHHTLCPVLSTISYFLWEHHPQSWQILWIPIMFTIVYGVIMLYLNGVRRIDGPYPFFRIHQQSVIASVSWTLGLSLFIGMLSGLIYWLG